MHPDLVVADDRLVEISGVELARQFRNDPRTSGLPFVLLTGSGVDGETPVGLDEAVSTTIPKPIDAMLLYNTVSNLIGKEPGAGAPSCEHANIIGGHETGERRGTVTPITLGRSPFARSPASVRS